MGKADREVLEERIREGEEKEKKRRRKEAKERMKKEKTSFIQDFKKFITKGNVLDMAVGVVVGTSFNAIVNGLVKYIITPAVTYFTSGVSVNELEYVIRPESVDAAGKTVAKISLQYGLWIQAIIDFLIIAFTVFVMVRVIKSAERKLNEKELAKAAEAEAKKKAEEAAAAAEAKKNADAKAAEEKAVLDEFYANVREQSALLREIRDSMKK